MCCIQLLPRFWHNSESVFLPSSHRKSGRATSCSGISFRKAGRWQRGLPVTILRVLSQSPSHASRQSQLKEFASKFLPQEQKKNKSNYKTEKLESELEKKKKEACFLHANQNQLCCSRNLILTLNCWNCPNMQWLMIGAKKHLVGFLCSSRLRTWSQIF